MAFQPKCKYCRRPLLRKQIDGLLPFAKTAMLMVCEYCDKIQRRRF